MQYISSLYSFITGSNKIENIVDITPVNFKILLVGDSIVGKTAFVQKHIDGDFVATYTPSRTYNDIELNFNIDNRPVCFEVIECGGQQKYNHKWNELSDDIDAAIIMFDITNKKSLESVEWYYNNLRKNNILGPIIIAGNKADCTTRDVSIEYVIAEYINNYDTNTVKYIDVSAKSNYNYEKPFLYLAKMLL
jgi:GTP-binding nuclear protein Ran